MADHEVAASEDGGYQQACYADLEVEVRLEQRQPRRLNRHDGAAVVAGARRRTSAGWSRGRTSRKPGHGRGSELGLLGSGHQSGRSSGSGGSTANSSLQAPERKPPTCSLDPPRDRFV